jgi:hypothetical protein
MEAASELSALLLGMFVLVLGAFALLVFLLARRHK